MTPVGGGSGTMTTPRTPRLTRCTLLAAALAAPPHAASGILIDDFVETPGDRQTSLAATATTPVVGGGAAVAPGGIGGTRLITSFMTTGVAGLDAVTAHVFEDATAPLSVFDSSFTSTATGDTGAVY